MSTKEQSPEADFDDALSRAFARVARARPDGVDKQIKKDGKDRRYVTLASVDDACREALTSENFSFPQLATTEPREGGGLWLTITTQIRRKGVMLESSLGLPVLGQMIAAKDGGGFREPTAQSVGSAMTYGRRYALSALMGVCPDEDDDGHQASQQREPEPDRLWLAYEAARTKAAAHLRVTEPQAHQRILALAEIGHDGEPSDPEVKRMIGVAEAMLLTDREPLTPGPDRDHAAAKGEQQAEPKARAKGKTKPPPAEPEPQEPAEPKAIVVARGMFQNSYKAYRAECEEQGPSCKPRPWKDMASEAIGRQWLDEKGAQSADEYMKAATFCEQMIERLRTGKEAG